MITSYCLCINSAFQFLDSFYHFTFCVYTSLRNCPVNREGYNNRDGYKKGKITVGCLPVSPNDVFNEVLVTFYEGKRCYRTLQMLVQASL